jgi:hypothetical protein
MNLSEYVIMFVLVAIMGAGLPGRVMRHSSRRARWPVRAS